MAQARPSDSTLPLSYRLDEACVSSSLRDVTLKFLPRNELETLIDIPNITAELRNKLGIFQCMWNPKLPEQVYNQARKVFAVLVLIEKVEAICELLKEGLTDENLPLRLKKGEPGVLESCSAKDPRVWKGIQGGAAARQFEETQWRLLAPVLNITGKHFGTSDERFGTSDERIILPIFDIDKEAIQRGMSPVFRGFLHWAHCAGLEVSTLHAPIKLLQLNLTKKRLRCRQSTDVIVKSLSKSSTRIWRNPGRKFLTRKEKT